jgi:hypothetical protein
MHADLAKIEAKLKDEELDDLLDLATAYRAGMEPEALGLVEAELYRRGISAAKIAKQREEYERECIYLADGTAAMCSTCRKPAVHEGWGWHKIMGKVPVFPRWLRSCKQHLPKEAKNTKPSS